jgi:hypothetical protein
MEKKQNSPQPDERSDRAKKSPVARREIRQSFLQAPPARKTKQTTNSDREKSALTLTRRPEGQQNSQVRCLKFQNLNFVLVLVLLPPDLKNKERDTHTHNTSLTPFFKSNETGVRFSKPVFGDFSTSKNGKR